MHPLSHNGVFIPVQEVAADSWGLTISLFGIGKAKTFFLSLKTELFISLMPFHD